MGLTFSLASPTQWSSGYVIMPTPTLILPRTTARLAKRNGRVGNNIDFKVVEFDQFRNLVGFLPDILYYLLQENLELAEKGVEILIIYIYQKQVTFSAPIKYLSRL